MLEKLRADKHRTTNSLAGPRALRGRMTILEAELCRLCSKDGANLLMYQGWLFMQYIDEVIRRQTQKRPEPAEGEAGRGLQGILPLTDWIIHFELLLFRLVVESQTGDVKPDPAEPASILNWITNRDFLGRLRSLFKNALILQRELPKEAQTSLLVQAPPLSCPPVDFARNSS